MSFELTHELKTGLLEGTLPPGIAMPLVRPRRWWELAKRTPGVEFELRYDRVVIRRDSADEFSVWLEAKGIPVCRLSGPPLHLPVRGAAQLVIDGRMEGNLR